MKNSLYVLIGLPGSGKSTLAKKMSENLKAKIVSSDSIRKDLFGDESCQDNPRLVFKLVDERIGTYLEVGDVIYDATNYSKKIQSDIINKWKDVADIIAVYIPTPYETCIYRNMSRDRVVPNTVLEKMNRKLHFPLIEDGWNRVIVKEGN